MKKLFQSVISLLVIAALFTPTVIYANETANFRVGDYIYFGSYDNAPILWRVIHIDETGNPMLFSDRILTAKAFDSNGIKHTNNTEQRTVRGSNFWQDSNIRQWLNSSEENINWIQNPPSASNVFEAPFAYDTEKGFLAEGNFTKQQREVILPRTHKSILSFRDIHLRDGGSVHYNAPNFGLDHTHKVPETWARMASIVHPTYYDAYYHNVTDKVFLLDVKEAYDYVYANRGILGETYYSGKATQGVVDKYNSTYDNVNLTIDTELPYWLRTPGNRKAALDYDSPIVELENYVTEIAKVWCIGPSSEWYGSEYHDFTVWLAAHRSGIRPALMLNAAKASKTKIGNGSLASPYELDLESKSEVTINVVDYKTGRPVENANISLGDANQSTDAFGQAIFEVDEGEYSLNISKEDYTESSTTLSVNGKQITKTIYLQEGIAINAVNVTMPDGGVRNLLTDSGFTVDKLDKNMYTIQADVNWNGNTGKIYLVGINSNIRKVFQGDTLHIQIGQEFPEDEKFYIDAVVDAPLNRMSLMQYSQNPYDEQRMLCIDVKDIAEEAKKGLEQYKMPTVAAPYLSIELLNNMGLQLDMKKIGAVVSVEVKDRKVMIKFGAGETLPERRGLLPPMNNAGALNRFTAMRMVPGTEVKLEVFGRVEIPIDTLINNGEYRGSVGFALSGERKSSVGNSGNISTIAQLQKQLFVGSIPVVVKLSVGAGFETEVGLKGTRRDFLDVSTTATITPKGSIRVSAGVGAVKVANVCVFGQGVLEGTINLTPEGNSFDPTIILSVGVELEVAKFQYEKVLFEDQFPKSGGNTLLNTLQGVNGSEFKLMGREPARSKAVLQEFSRMSVSQNMFERLSQTVDYLAFSNAKSKPMLISEDTYMIYQVDDIERNEVNGLKLVFSQGEAMTWHPPADIHDDGTADGSFDVQSSGDTAFVVWENIKTTFPDNHVNLTTYMSNSEIAVSRFNHTTKQWDLPVTLTNNTIADFSPALAVSGEKAVAVWMSNSESDIFGVNGINHINYVFYENGAWQNINVIADVGLVNDISVAYDGNTAVLCYDKDMDGNLATNTDRDVFIKNLSQSSSSVSISGGVNTNYSGKVFIQNDKFNVAYLNHNGVNIIHDIWNPVTSLITEIDTIEGYGIELIQNGNNAGILWLETGVDGFNKLWGTYYDTITNTWSAKSITNANTGYESDIKNLSAIMNPDGSILLSYLQAPKPQRVINDDGTTTIDKGYIMLQAFAYTPGYNVRIRNDSIAYDEELYAKNIETPITFDLEVTGEKAFTDEIQIMVYEGHPEYGGVLINTDTISGTFNPGDVVSVETSYLPPATSGRKEIYIKVVPDNTEEFDLWDNIGFVSLGYGFLSVKEVYFEKDRDLYLLNSTIANKGAVTANNITVSVYENNIGGNLIYSEQIEELASNDTKQIQHPIAADSIIFDDFIKSYYVEITLENNDDSAFIDVGSMLGVIENPEYQPSFEVLIAQSKINYDNGLDTSIIVKNNTGCNKQAKLITALYDEYNRLIALSSQDVVILAGMSVSKQFALDVNGNLSGYTQKAFLWDTFANIMPLTKNDLKDVILY